MSKYICLSTKIRFKKDSSNYYVTGWKSKGVYNSKHAPLQGAFLPDINHCASKIGIQLNNTPLVVEQNNYMIKTVNAYNIYVLDNCPLKSCLFCIAYIVKNGDKEKYVHNGYGIAFRVLVMTLQRIL